MRAFTLPYRVLFHDTMAYGSHHFLTNLKFQCLVREHLFFSQVVEGSDGGQALHDDTVILTRDAYCLNLNPVGVGERVAILLTVEAATRMSVRFCFRVVHADGRPVTAGYQTLVALDKDTQALVSPPPWLREAGAVLREPLGGDGQPDFAAHLHAGRTKAVFDPATLELAATALADRAFPADGDTREVRIADGGLPALGAEDTVFLFPGQGSYDPGPLRALLAVGGDSAARIREADTVGRQLLGASLLALLEAPADEHDVLLERAPDLGQIGIYLGAVLAARELMARGLSPALMVGHSLGEIAALAAAGVMTVADGARVVAQRALALRTLGPGVGGMLALVGPVEVSRGLLREIGGAWEAVVNHGEQLVAAGRFAALERLERAAGAAGVSTRRLMSPMPFHSPLLAPACAPFATAVGGVAMTAPSVPVYSPIEGRLLGADGVAQVLAGQLVKPLDFVAGMQRVHEAGGRRFVECGGGAVLTGLTRRILGGVAVGSPLGRRGDVLAALDVAAGIESRIANLESRIPNRESRIPNLESRISNPESRIPNGESRIPNLESRIPNPESRIPNGESRIATLESREAATSPLADTTAESEVESRHSPFGIRDSGVGIRDSGFGIRDSGFEIRDSRFAIRDSGFAIRESPSEEPIAIVAQGCILPAAHDPAALWQSVLHGTAGIHDALDLDPTLADFLSDTLTPDKTYTLLGGFVRDFDAADVLKDVYPPGGIAPLSKAQRYLAAALDQCRQALAVGADDAHNDAHGDAGGDSVLLAVGSTADGQQELDEALLAEALVRRVATLKGAESHREALIARIDRVLDAPRDAIARLEPHAAYAAVGEHLFGDAVRTVAVDAACASSLYAVDMGVRALRQGTVDLALCGGVFAPGPANSCLFSQFRGLSSTGSRPFDVGADGVVFGEGAAVLALRRLSDARARGERVLAVIRSVGTSSDGRGPSVAVPRADGQVLAMERAWARAGLDPASAGYVEAHATSTPVGDAVEFSAIRRCFGERERALPLGSLKALTGHTGWAAGAASLIKVVQALGARTLPPQAAYTAPNARIELGDAFQILDAPTPWAAPDGGPRRAGVNGFGFGGSNAHVVLEEAPPEALDAPSVSPRTPRRRVAVVGIGAPLAGGRFDDDALALPKGRPILPDVLDDLDRSHRLAVRAAHAALPEGWEALRREAGVVLGLSGKTERSTGINQRLYRDRLRRLLSLENGVPSAMVEALLASLDRERTSGPYTLPGLMPNVAAGRVSSFFDLMGPNLVLDAGEGSLWEALSLAEQLLRDGSCRLVLAGALSATTAPELAGDGAPLGEGALVLALMTPEQAREQGLPVMGLLELAALEDARPGAAGWREHAEDHHLRGAQGASAVARALSEAGEGHVSPWLRLAAGALRLRPDPGQQEPAEPPPLLRTTPRFTALPTLPVATTLQAASASGALLVLADAGITEPQRLDAHGPITVLPASGEWRQELDAIDLERFDAVVALRGPPGGRAGPAALAEDRLVDRLLAAAQAGREAIAAGRLRIGALNLGAVDEEGRAHPLTGPTAGLLKALARELPEAICKVVSVSSSDPSEGLARLWAEWACADGPTEVLVRGDGAGGFQRGALRLHALGQLSRPVGDRGDDPGWRALGPGSLVVVTGGARGVTGTLTESLLRRYGCTVVLLGRSDPADAPAALVEVNDDELSAWETRYYREERARRPEVSLPQLRRDFGRLAACREVARTLARLAELPGAVYYRSVDLTDPAAVARFVDGLAGEHGAPDLLVHGAGVQYSSALAKVRPERLRQELDTKLGGLGALTGAIAARCPEARLRVHLLGSAFSYFGNDGQYGYGAANESLGRLAAWTPGWSCIAWPGWRSLGMTRGSEYAAVARSRGLRPMDADEGQALFLELLDGPTQPGAAWIAAVSQGELDWAGEALVRPGALRWPMTPDAHPFAGLHKVRGQPTLPGTFGLELLARAARAAHPERALVAVEGLDWQRFARLDARGELRAELTPLSGRPGEAALDARLRSDFVHASGRVLQAGVTHFVCRLRLGSAEAASDLAVPEHDLGALKADMPDPYSAGGPDLDLSGPFRCLRDIQTFERGQRASFVLPPIPLGAPAADMRGFALPSLLMDAVCRLAMCQRRADGSLPLYFPIRCDRFRVAPGLNDAALQVAGAPVTLFATAPRRLAEAAGDPSALRCERAWAVSGGRILMVAEGLVARYAGDVTTSPHPEAPLGHPGHRPPGLR